MNNFFLYVTKTQAYQQKTEKFFVSEEKKFGRIDSRAQLHQRFEAKPTLCIQFKRFLSSFVSEFCQSVQVSFVICGVYFLKIYHE